MTADSPGAYTGGAMTIGMIGPRLRRPATRRGVRRGGPRRRRARRRPAQDRRDPQRRVLHRGHPVRAAARRVADRIEATTARAAARALRRGAHLRADAADREPRARPRPADRGDARRSPACCSRASSSCSSRRPTRARRASGSRRCSRSPGSSPGRDFHLAFSPERVDPGRTDYTLRTTPKVVGGLTEACGDRAVALYEQVCDDDRPRLARPRRPSWPSCWRTSSAR